ncbi:hypothetical protein BH11MYX1_BH11MYX1_15420 [soil metagenome]
MKPLFALVWLVATSAEAPLYADEAPGWKLEVPECVELATAGTGTLPLAITLEHGRTVSKDAGVVLDLSPEGGVSVKRRRLGRSDAIDPDEDAPRFAIPLRAEAVGDFTIKLHLRFWLCGTRVCRPIDARRTVTVSVTDH